MKVKINRKGTQPSGPYREVVTGYRYTVSLCKVTLLKKDTHYGYPLWSQLHTA